MLKKMLFACLLMIACSAPALAAPVPQDEPPTVAEFKKTIEQEMNSAKGTYKGNSVFVHGGPAPYEWCRWTQELDADYKVTVQKAEGNGPSYVATVEFQKKNLYYTGKNKEEMLAAAKPNEILIDRYVLNYSFQDGKWKVVSSRRLLWSMEGRWLNSNYTSVFTAAKNEM